jgi:hypothetical protein
LVLFGFLLENTRLCHRKKKESEKVKGFVIYFRLAGVQDEAEQRTEAIVDHFIL